MVSQEKIERTIEDKFNKIQEVELSLGLNLQEVWSNFLQEHGLIESIFWTNDYQNMLEKLTETINSYNKPVQLVYATWFPGVCNLLVFDKEKLINKIENYKCSDGI